MYPPLHPRFPGLPLFLLDKLYTFVNGLPPCSRPRIRYSIKNLGHPVMTSGFLFPVKIQPPHSHTIICTNTLMYSAACHTPNKAGPASAANILVCTYNLVSINVSINVCHICHLDSVNDIVACFFYSIGYILVVSVQRCELYLQQCVSLGCKMTRAAVSPRSSPHLICFYFMYTSSHFTCQRGRFTSVKGPLKQQ